MITAEFEIDLGRATFESVKLRLLELLIFYRDFYTQPHTLDPVPTAQLLSNIFRKLCDSVRVAQADHDYHGLLVNGRKHRGLIDNGASSNIMSLAFANKNEIEMERYETPFIMADGSVQLSVARAIVDCGIPQRGQRALKCQFHVFTSAPEPVILGRPFLYDIGVCKPPDRAYTCHSTYHNSEAAAPGLPAEKRQHRLRPHLRLQIWYRGTVHEALAMVDKGAGADFMSLEYARSLGYEPRTWCRHASAITLGNGHTIRTVGLIRALVCFPWRRELDVSYHKDFVIVAGFPFDIAIGNPFIRALEIYEKCIANLEWISEDAPHLCPIFLNPKGNAEPKEDARAKESHDDVNDCYDRAARSLAPGAGQPPLVAEQAPLGAGKPPPGTKKAPPGAKKLPPGARQPLQGVEQPPPPATSPPLSPVNKIVPASRDPIARDKPMNTRFQALKKASGSIRTILPQLLSGKHSKAAPNVGDQLKVKHKNPKLSHGQIVNPLDLSDTNAASISTSNAVMDEPRYETHGGATVNSN